MQVTVEIPFEIIPTFHVPLGSSPVNPETVYVVLLVPHDTYLVVPEGEVTTNLKESLPLLTLQ